MRAGDWLNAEARRTFAEAVKAIEARTSAEIVVIVRDRSAPYKHVNVAFGAVLGAAMLVFYIYFPITFVDDLAVPSVIVAFLAGLMLGGVDTLKRPCLSKRERRDAVRIAARAAFYDTGVSSTRARSGVLVYVSLLEREIEVVPDVGVHVPEMGKAWTDAVAALEAAARDGAEPARVVETMKPLGDALAATMPVGADDVNELSDEVIA